MTKTLKRPMTEPAIAPAKQWQNWWRDLGPDDPEEPYPDCDIWPSKEIAEQKAADEIRSDIREWGTPTSKHLGAFPMTP